MTLPRPKTLNVPNVSSKPNKVNLNDIEGVVDSEQQNWFKRARVGKFLWLVNIHRSTARLANEDQKIRAFLQAGGGCHIMTPPGEDA